MQQKKWCLLFWVEATSEYGDDTQSPFSLSLSLLILGNASCCDLGLGRYCIEKNAKENVDCIYNFAMWWNWLMSIFIGNIFCVSCVYANEAVLPTNNQSPTPDQSVKFHADHFLQLFTCFISCTMRLRSNRQVFLYFSLQIMLLNNRNTMEKSTHNLTHIHTHNTMAS